MQAFIVVTEQEAAEDGYVIEAVITRPYGDMSADERAYDVAERVGASDKVNADAEVKVLQVLLDPTNLQLEVTPDISEVKHGDFALAAYLELKRKGTLMVPLWANPAWLVHEVKARFDVGIDFRGRQMTLVSPEEMRSRRDHGIPDVNAPSDFGDDAGFVETRD